MPDEFMEGTMLEANWGAIFAVTACLIFWAGFLYWIVGLV